MANTASQRHRNSRTERERLENLHYKSAIKTYFRRLESAAAEGSTDKIADEHRQLCSTIDKAAKVGAIHANNAARKKSRAARLVNA